MIADKVFVPKASSSRRVFDILNIIGCSEKAGDVGLEIEMEGNKFPRGGTDHYIPPHWVYHADGSLRGEDNAEYVLKKPLFFDQVPEAVNKLYMALEEYGTVCEESNRTSVHVHLNVQKWHLNRLCSFMALYFSVEELLTAWCGDHRVGNLFCLRAKDAPAIISKIKRFIRTDGTTSLSDGLHYSAMNAQAIQKFGSVEIRTLRGVTDPDIILKWVEILRRIYDLSADFADPRSVCADFSGNGPLEYLQMVLGSHTSTIRDGIGYDSQQIMESLYEGIRLAQDIAYCRDWDEFKAMVVKPDPFGRSTKKIAKKLTNAEYVEYYHEGIPTSGASLAATTNQAAALYTQLIPPNSPWAPIPMLASPGNSPYSSPPISEDESAEWLVFDEFGNEEPDF